MRSGICSSSFLPCSCASNAVVYKNVHYGCCCCCFIMEPNALMVRSTALKDYTGGFFFKPFSAHHSQPFPSLSPSLFQAAIIAFTLCHHGMNILHAGGARDEGGGGVISVTTESLYLFLCEELEALTSLGLSPGRPANKEKHSMVESPHNNLWSF